MADPTTLAEALVEIKRLNEVIGSLTTQQLDLEGRVQSMRDAVAEARRWLVRQKARKDRDGMSAADKVKFDKFKATLDAAP